MSLTLPAHRHLAFLAKAVVLGTASFALSTSVAPANITFDLRASEIQPGVGMLSGNGKAITLNGNAGTVTLQLWAQTTNAAPTNNVFGVQTVLGSIVSTSSAQPLLTGSLAPAVFASPFENNATAGNPSELSNPPDGVQDLGSNQLSITTNFIKFRKDPTASGTQVGAVFFASNLNPAGATVNPISNGFEFLMGTVTFSIDSFANQTGSLSLNWKIPAFTTPANRGQIAQWTDGDGAVNNGNTNLAEMSVGSPITFSLTPLVERTWTASGGGNWGFSGNWNSGVPDGATFQARFGSSITTASTVTLDGDKTLSRLSFASENEYTIARGAAGALRILSSIEVNEGSHSITAPLVIDSSTIVADVSNGSGTLLLSGPVTGAGGLTKVGVGKLVLSGANTFSSLTTVAEGTVEFNSSGNNAIGGNVRVSGGTLRLLQSQQIPDASSLSIATATADLGAHAETVTGFQLLSGAIVGSGAVLTNLGTSDVQSGTVGVTVAGPAGLNKTTAGTVRLTAQNTYDGLTSVSAGILELAAAAGGAVAGDVSITGGTVRLLAPNQIADGSSVSVTSGTIDLGTFSETVGDVLLNEGAIVGTNSTLTSSKTFNLNSGTVSTRLSGAAGLIKSGDGKLTLSSGNSYTGGTTINGGALQILSIRVLPAGGSMTITSGTLDLSVPSFTTLGALSGAGSIILGTGADLLLDSTTGSALYSGVISGSLANVTKSGGGEQTLSGTNSYSGLTTVNGGRLILTTPSTSSDFIVKNQGILRLETATFSLMTRSLRADAGGVLEYKNSTIQGGFLRGPGAHVVLPGATAHFSGVTTFNSTQLLQSGSTTFTNFTNGGEVINSAPLTWDGGVNTSSGRFSINSNVTVRDWTNDGVVTIRSGGVLNGTGSNLVSGGGSRLALEPEGRLNIPSGMALDLLGSLLTNNGTISGKTNVYFGSVAKGDGVFGAVSVFDGGKFSPGNSPGTATINGILEWAAGGIMDFELADALGSAGAATGWDLVKVTGFDGFLAVNAGTTSNSRFTIRVASQDANNPAPAMNFDNTASYQWLLAETSQGITGFNADEIAIDARDFVNPLGGGSFGIVEDGRNVYLNFRPVPEPTAFTILLGALGLCGTWRRRR